MSILFGFIGVASIAFGVYAVKVGPTDIQLGVGITSILGGLCLLGIAHITDLIKKQTKAQYKK